MSETGRRAGGRRSDHGGPARSAGGRRVDLLVVLALVLPCVTAAGLGAIGSEEAPASTHGPSDTALSHVGVACPSPIGAPAGDVQVTRVPGVDGGDVGVRVGDRSGALAEAGSVAADDGLTAVPDSRAAAVLTADGAAAPGLVAGRAEPDALAECREPAYDEWFVGLGATATQSSVIELVNTESAPAVVDVVVHTASGADADASWRGVTVPGHSTHRIALSERPVRSAVAAHVTVTRGRVMATARHTFDALGRSEPTTDYVPSQAEPATSNLLLGVPGAGLQRLLFLANPSDDEVRASVRVVTGDSTFAPSGSREIAVPPQSVVQVQTSGVLDSPAADGALGLRVDSSDPLAVGMRALVDGDLTTLAPVTSTDQPVAAVVPRGRKRLVLGGADATGVVRVTAATADGRVIWDRKAVEVAADRGFDLALPPLAERLVVETRGTAIAGTVVATGPRGTATLRLRPARTSESLPDVRPAS